MKQKLPINGSLLSYSYERRENSDRRNSTSYQVHTCATSGLPLGYFPTKKIHYAPAIPFSQLSLHDMRAAISAAVESDARSRERIFAFFCLLYKVPEPILEIKCQQLVPAWHDPRLGALLSDNGLRNFAGFVEAILVLHPKHFREFPRFIISRSVSHDSTDLREFPSLLARWIGVIETTTANQKKAHHSEPVSLRIFKRGRNAARNIFAPSKSNGTEITEYAKILADFYDRPYTLKWDEFVRNPTIFTSKKLRELIQNITAINIGDDDFGDELQLSIAFKQWLEEAHLLVVQQEEAAARMHKIINVDTFSAYGEMTETSLEFLQNHAKELDIVSNKPARSDYKTLEEFMAALSAWRKNPKSLAQA